MFQFSNITSLAKSGWSTRGPILLTMAVTLASCQIDAVQRPESALQFNSDWVNDQVSAEAVADLDNWWLAFSDPTLNQLVEQSLSQNLDLQAAYSVVMEARAQIDRQTLRQRPNAELSAAVNQRRQSENGPLPISNIPGLDTDQTIHDVGAAMVWELDLFDRIANSIAAADARFQASQFDVAAMAAIVSAEIADHYFNYRLLITQQHSLEQQLELLRTNIALFEARQRTGDISNIPVSQLRIVESDLLQRQQQLVLLETQRVNALARLSGQVPENLAGLLRTVYANYQLPAIPRSTRTDMLARRPDVLAADARLAASLSDQAIAKAEHFPRFNLSASGGLQALDLNNLVDSGSDVFSITPIFTWRLLDGRRIQAEIAVADARARAAAAQYEAIVISALVEAENSFAQAAATQDRTEQQVQSLDSNREIVALQELRFTAGDINRSELIESQMALLQAQDLLEARKTEQATSLVRLFKALGGGWNSSTEES